MKNLYWLYLVIALLTGASCVLAVQHHRSLLAVLYGATSGINLMLFWTNWRRA